MARLSYGSLPLAASPTTDFLAAFVTEPLLLGAPFSRRWCIDNWQKRRLEDRTGGSTTPPRHAPSSPAGQSPSASPQRKGAAGKGRSRRDVDGESSASEGRNDGADLLRLLPRKADATTNEAELTSALGEALTQIATAHKCFKSQPNRASKLYFTAAKSLAQLGRIREAAETLQFLLLLQHVEHNRGQQQESVGGDAVESGECTTTADTRELASNCVYLSNPARAKLVYTAHLWLARLSRAFDSTLATQHYRACCDIFLSRTLVDHLTDQAGRLSGPARVESARSIFEDLRSRVEAVEALWSVVERPEQLFSTLLEAAAFFSLRSPSPRSMVIYLVASEAASRFERWGDVSLCMRRASTVCFALSEVWVGLDLLAESHVIQQKAKLPPPPTVGSGGETAEDPSGVLQDLLYASIALGDRVRQREAREWALASEQPLSLETQFLCEVVASGQCGDMHRLEQAGIDYEALLEQHRHLRDLYSHALAQSIL